MFSFTLYPNPLFFLPLFSVAAITFILGIFVFNAAKRTLSAVSLSLFCLHAAIWGGCYAIGNLGIHPTLTVLAAYGAVLGALPIPFFFLLLCSSFPDNSFLKRSQIFLLLLPSLILLFSFPTKQLIEVSVSENGQLLVKLGYFNYLYMLHIVVYFLAGIITALVRYLRSSAHEKIRYRYFFAGLLLSAIWGYLFSEFIILLGIHKYISLGPIGIVFLVGFTAYAILKYRLMDISIVIKKTTAYSLVTTGITFTYVLVVLAFELLLRSMWGYYSFWAAVPASLVIAVTFVPLRERLQGVTDRIFFRRTIEYQNVVRDVTRLIVSVTDLHTLFRLIDRTIVRVMCLKNASILLLEEKENQYVVEKTNGLPQVINGIRLVLDDPLVSYLIEKKDAVVLEEVKALARSDSVSPAEKEELKKVQAEMENFEAAVSIPSFLKNKLVGILNLGEKLSGELYSPEDLELLLTMGTEAGIAIENAKLYRDISETRDYLNSLIKSSEDAIVSLNLEGKALSWNEGAQKIFGYDPEEIVGKSVPFLEESETSDYISRILRGEEVKAVELLKNKKDGGNVPLLLTCSPIKDAEGNIIGVSAIIKDITELKKVDELKSEFLSVVSHELRTPLTPIKGYLSLLLGGQLGEMDPKQKEALKIILNQSNHLHNLIDTVIDISRIEAGKRLELEKEPIFLEEVVKEIVGASTSAFSAKNIRIEARYPESSLVVIGDKKKLLRVLDNLLGNALKFTPSGGMVQIAVKKGDNRMEVTVADTGIGIEAKYLSKIFERFYQIDSSYTRSVGGIGMGLAIAKEVVEAHGGKIWTESEGPGRGTKIVFTLPIG
jgi:two-component system phosphate regulon sensor histidine kinase PhoR